MTKHVQPTSVGVASPCLFETGYFVRLTNQPNVVGRVVENAGDRTTITILDGEGPWQEGDTPTFGPGSLVMWTPDAAAKPPIDIEQLATSAMRSLGGYELIGALCRAKRVELDSEETGIHVFNEWDNFLDNLESIKDVYGDVACGILDMLSRHED